MDHEELSSPSITGSEQVPHRGTLILVLGILSLVLDFMCCCGITGIFAWVMANSDLREMDEGLMDSSGRDITFAGKICGIIGTGLMALGALLIALYFLFIFVMIGTRGNL